MIVVIFASVRVVHTGILDHLQEITLKYSEEEARQLQQFGEILNGNKSSGRS